MIGNVSYLAAFIAGVFSISSPCVLPLVPIYLAHIAGVTVGETGLAVRATVIRNALAYVTGFSIVFVAMGAALGAVGAAAGTLDFVAQNRIWMVRIGGMMLIAFGLYQVGLVRIPFLDRDKRLAIGGAHLARLRHRSSLVWDSAPVGLPALARSSEQS